MSYCPAADIGPVPPLSQEEERIDPPPVWAQEGNDKVSLRWNMFGASAHTQLNKEGVSPRLYALYTDTCVVSFRLADP